MACIKALHLSDPHIKKEGNDDVRACTAYIDEHYPNHYRIWTGDIVNNGRKDEYEQAAKLISGHAVPGNHCVGEHGNFDQRRRLKRFDLAFGTTFAKNKAVQVDIIENRVALIGLNSNPGTWGFFLDFARGKIGRKQRSSLRMELEACRGYVRVVYLHHHPFMASFLMKLGDSEKLMKTLSHNCDVLLFGHKHRQRGFTLKEMEHNIAVIHGAGALYKENGALEVTIDSDKVISAKYVRVI